MERVVEVLANRDWLKEQTTATRIRQGEQQSINAMDLTGFVGPPDSNEDPDNNIFGIGP